MTPELETQLQDLFDEAIIARDASQAIASKIQAMRREWQEKRAGEAIEAQNTVDDALHVIAHKAGREQKEQICKDVAACIMMNYGDVYVAKTIRAHCQFLTSYMEKPVTALNLHDANRQISHTMKDGRVLTFEKNRYYIEARERETK